MKPLIKLPEDESIHRDFDCEWWYFNGFLKGKRDYAFMNCLFRVKGEKVKISLFKLPIKDLFFSHSILFDLKSKKVSAEMLPIVIVSDDSFKKEGLFVNYRYPFRKNSAGYEIARHGDFLRIKNRFLDLSCRQTKKPLFEGENGLVTLGKKKTFYFSYTNMEASGFIGKDPVKGKVWHDRQWFDINQTGYDSWVWFSIQMPDNTELVCARCNDEKYAYLLHANNRQESCEVTFKSSGRGWKSPVSGLTYKLEWEILLKNYVIKTRPVIKKSEVNFGVVNYWEGPLVVSVNGKEARGFMEYILPNQPTIIESTLRKGGQELFSLIKRLKRHL